MRKEIFSKTRSGELPARIIDAADALMEHKARRYGVPRDAWDAADRFERVRRLQQVVIEELECRYRGAVQEGFIRRRAIKIRMRIYERLRDQPVDAICARHPGARMGGRAAGGAPASNSVCT